MVHKGNRQMPVSFMTNSLKEKLKALNIRSHADISLNGVLLSLETVQP
jgi:hypothetical protein